MTLAITTLATRTGCLTVCVTTADAPPVTPPRRNGTGVKPESSQASNRVGLASAAATGGMDFVLRAGLLVRRRCCLASRTAT